MFLFLFDVRPWASPGQASFLIALGLLDEINIETNEKTHNVMAN